MEGGVITLTKIAVTLMAIAWLIAVITIYLKGKMYLSWQFTLVFGLGTGVMAYDAFTGGEAFVGWMSVLATVVTLFLTIKSAKIEYDKLKHKKVK